MLCRALTPRAGSSKEPGKGPFYWPPFSVGVDSDAWWGNPLTDLPWANHIFLHLCVLICERKGYPIGTSETLWLCDCCEAEEAMSHEAKLSCRAPRGGHTTVSGRPKLSELPRGLAKAQAAGPHTQWPFKPENALRVPRCCCCCYESGDQVSRTTARVVHCPVGGSALRCRSPGWSTTN